MKAGTVEFALWYADTYLKEALQPRHCDYQVVVLAEEVRRLRKLLEEAVL